MMLVGSRLGVIAYFCLLLIRVNLLCGRYFTEEQRSTSVIINLFMVFSMQKSNLLIKIKRSS